MNPRPTKALLDILLADNVLDSVNPATGTGWIGCEGLESKPDTMISAIPAGGRDPNPAWPIDYPHVQLIVRGREGDFAAAYSKAIAVSKALLGKANFTQGSDIWASIRLLGDIAFIGYDQNQRPMFSINLELIIHPAALGNRREII